MKTIYILRHAKSDRGDISLKDHDRPLNERGREAAPRVAAHMKAKRHKPDIILCSTALRTVQTYDLIKDAVEGMPVKFEESLYLAEERHLLERLKWLEDDLKSAMIIGHNPGLEQLANTLAASPKDADSEKMHRRMREKFSTCALAVVKVPVKTWREVKAGAGKLADFMRPKDL